MEQKNVLRNITGTACICFALSTMSVNGTMVVNGYNTPPEAIHSNFELSYSNSKKSDISNIYKTKSQTRLEEANALFGEMRDATAEEQASVNKYIKSISKDTGVNFFDIC